MSSIEAARTIGTEAKNDSDRQVVGDVTGPNRQRTDGSNYKTRGRFGVEQRAESGRSLVPFWNDGQAGLDVGRLGQLANGLGRAHRVERAGDDLAGARAACIVGRFGLEQFGVSQDDSELVIQPMKQQPQLGVDLGPVCCWSHGSTSGQ